MGRARRTGGAALVLAVGLATAGCAAPAGGDAATAAITVASDAFTEGETIPAEFTCEGGGEFPGITWTGTADAASVAVVVDDPDAPGGTFVHLVVLDLPAGTTELDDPAAGNGSPALNSAGSSGWTPPCPPSGEHRYRFTVYALSAPTGLAAGAAPAEAIDAIEDRAVGEGTLTGLVAAS